MKIIDFLGEKVVYDSMGQKLFAVQKNGHHQMLADMRGWGAIQNLFKNKDGTIREEEAAKYQDDIGQYLADAINEKVERERKGV